MNEITPPPKPKPLIGKDGNPVVNQFGHIVSERLTDEQKAAIDRMKAEGKTNKVIIAELGITYTRMRTYLHERDTAARITELQHTEVLGERTETIIALLVDITKIVEKMETRVSDVQTQCKAIYKAGMRQKLGREKAEREVRTQKAEIRKLKAYIHKRTGQKW